MRNTEQQNSSLTLHGVGIGAGSACGTLKFYQRISAYSSKAEVGDRETERKRLLEAREKAKRKIELLHQKALAEIGEKEAEIFEIHGMLIDDEDFADLMNALIEEGIAAEKAVSNAAQKYAEILQALPDPYLSARAADIGDIERQILAALDGGGETDGAEESEAYILVADDLAPSETVSLDKSKILGFVTFGGTPNSHTAILARAMGIPALIGVGSMEASLDGETGLLNAGEGTLVVSPNEAERSSFQKKMGQENELAREHEKYLRSLINKPAITRSGRKLLIYANVGREEDVAPALLNGAEGIGLLRSEFLYLSLDRYPTEEELFESY
ncbi:MAG: phosphoenolpyruvate--protein phosphotransferase, partial [Clostridia bacterium]|nr:phosphoenolpyruvate--protein phosphotransferase [Clostridia bacterium]